MPDFSHRAGAAALFAIPVAAIASPAMAADDSDNYVQFGLGVDYSKGDYGDTQDTEILAVPASVKVKHGDFTIRASLPYVRVKGPGSVVPGDGGAIPGGTIGPVTTTDGIGDLSLAAGYTLPVGKNTFLDLSARVKVPTASETKNLGTGTTDVTAQAEVTQVFGPVSASVRGGRRFNGSNVRFPLRDVWQAGGSLYYQAGAVTVGADYDWRKGSLPTARDRSELTGSVSYKLNDKLRLQGYAYTGFTDGSPNAGGGLQVVFRL